MDFLKILISNTSDSPLYQQIKDQIKDAVLNCNDFKIRYAIGDGL